jgi:c-di-GMP-related signal transduction protein
MPAQRSPVKPGHLYQNICNRGLADHCLDEAGAWGILGWPDEDVLHAWRHRPLGCDPVVIALIRQALSNDRSLDQIERFVRQDPVLVYRLLTYLNSVAFGGHREVDSLRHAIMMLGFSAFEQWLGQQLAGSDSDTALHPVRYAHVMRSRLAQHLLEPGSDEDLRAEVYVTALFAQLDRLLQQPLADLLAHLPLCDRVADALLREQGPYFPLIDIARAQGDPERLERLPGICETHEMSLEQANRALLRMLATSRDHGLTQPKQPG